MLITRTFLDKCNTIMKGSAANMGLNPILQLFYGNTVSRALLYFDHNKVKRLVEDKTYPELSRLHHRLRLWNASDINLPIIDDCMPGPMPLDTHCRAVSFELVAFLIPRYWDAGRGFDAVEDPRPAYRKAYSEFGSNWYSATTADKWENPGIYTREQIAEMIEDGSPVIVGTQRFDFGNETFDLDITDTFNRFIDGSLENYGMCIAFAPAYEEMKLDESQYAGFFSSETHTFFEPYVETRYDGAIEDDRVNFYIGKENRLYFYANIGGNDTNLDQLPTCTVEGTTYAVSQATKGLYCVTLPAEVTSQMTPDTMYYDTWSGIVYKGQQYPDIELQFTAKNGSRYFSFGLPYNTEKTPKFTPELYGIKNNEHIRMGDVRKLIVDCRIWYTTDQLYAVDNLEYRLYTWVEDKQITVVDWTKVDREYNTNSFLVNTSELVPQTYSVDIKARYNNEELVTANVLTFTVVPEYADN